MILTTIKNVCILYRILYLWFRKQKKMYLTLNLLEGVGAP